MDDLDSVPSEGSHLEIPVVEFRNKIKPAKLDPRIKLRSHEECKYAILINKEKSVRDVENIVRALGKHFIFSNLSTENRVALISHMKLLKLNENEIVFEQGSIGQNFYILAKGKLSIHKDGKLIAELTTGETFGEIALLYNSLRSATIKTVTKVYLWRLDQLSFKLALHAVNKEKNNEILQFVLKVPIFENLTKAQINSIVESMSLFTFNKNKMIIKAGEAGNGFYIIKSGTVKVYQDECEQTELNRGDYFGEASSIYNTPYQQTIIAATEVTCLVLSKKSVVSALGSELKHVIYENSKKCCLKNSRILNKLDFHVQQSLSNNINISVFGDGELVIPEFTPKKSKLFFVIKGTLANPSQIVANTYDIADELALSQNSNDVWPENVYARGECHIGEITKSQLEKIIGMKVKHLSKYSEIFQAFRKISIFNTLSNEKIFEIISKAQLLHFPADTVIIEQGSVGLDFFVIKSGKVEIIKTGEILRTENKRDYFGERALLFDEIRSAAVVAKENVACWVLNKSDFASILSSEIRNRLTQRIFLQDNSVHLSDLSEIKFIGGGTFGQVFLVSDLKTSQFYALKKVTRQIVEKFHLSESLVLEKNILKSIDHPLILKLINTFKDSQNVYFLAEYVRGIDLFDILRDFKAFDELQAKFYTVCLVLILEYLHEREIIYRDLKPENIRIDCEGYIKLIDFGTCKYIKEKTYTIIGTPHYMPPEMILGYGYSFSADLWSLGVILYEMIHGQLPFAETETDPAKIYEQILTKKVEYELNRSVSNECYQFINILLSKKPVRRCGGSIEGLKQCEWIKNSQWEMFINKNVPSPYIPKDYNDLISEKGNTPNLRQALVSNQEHRDNYDWCPGF